MMNKLVSTLCLMLVVAAPLSHADAKGSIQELSWMTGSWAAQLGPNTLEENWIEAKDGSISSLVRMTGGGKTSMIELIVIEEKGDSLELHVQQWDPGYKPRAEAQRMKLIELGEKSVMFEALTEGGMKKLGYSSPSEGMFNINIVTATDQKMTLPLKAK